MEWHTLSETLFGGIRRFSITGGLALLVLLSACQSVPLSRTEKDQVKRAVTAFQQSINTRSLAGLTPYLAPNIQTGGLPPEMSLAGLQSGMYWTRYKVGEFQILSARKRPEGIEARVALYSRGVVMPLRMSFDSAGRIQSIDSAPLWEPPRASVPPVFTSDFTVSGNLMFVQGTVNGRTGYFLFDTGASGLLLNRKYFSAAPEIGAAGISGSVNGLKKRLGYAEVESLRWGGLRVGGITGELHDFTQLEKPTISPLLGAISYNELKDCAVNIDWRARKIQVFATSEDGAKKIPASGPRPTAVLPFTYFSHLPVVKAHVGDREYALLFDSGAESNVLPDDAGLGGHFRPQGLITITDGSRSGGATGLAGVVDQMVLGNIAFRNVPVAIYQTPYLSGKGFLGSPLLQQGRVEINFRAREILLWH